MNGGVFIRAREILEELEFDFLDERFEFWRSVFLQNRSVWSQAGVSLEITACETLVFWANVALKYVKIYTTIVVTISDVTRKDHVNYK